MAKNTKNIKKQAPIGVAASQMLTLEPRIMLDAAALATGAEIVVDTSPTVADTSGLQLPDNMEVKSDPRDAAKDQADANGDDEENSQIQPLAATSDNKHGIELVVVDKSIADYEGLIAGLTDRDGEPLAHDRMVEIIEIETDADGVLQITNALSQYDNISAVHILSHADQGELHLGSSVLNAENLDSYSDLFSSWQAHLSDGADLLLYGCDVAGGESGIQFVNEIGELTGTDVAASTDTTGSESLGANWHLEYSQGDIETGALAVTFVDSWQGTLAASIDIEKNADVAAAAPGDTITYTITVVNDSDMGETITNVDITDALDPNLIFNDDVVISLATTVNDTYTAVGNTQLFVDESVTTTNPAAIVSETLLTNDMALLGPTARFSEVNGTAVSVGFGSIAFSTTSGNVTVNEDGSMVYTPNLGVTGVTDTFTYVSTNDSLTFNATVTINIQDQVWYAVSNGALPAGTGSSTNPFNSFTELLDTGGSNPDGVGDYIYLDPDSTGSNVGTGTLLDGQKLIGGGVDLIVGGYTLEAASSQTLIANTNPSVLTAASGNEIAGFNFNVASTQSGLIASSEDGLTLRDSTFSLTANAATPISLSELSGSVVLDSLVIDGSANTSAPTYINFTSTTNIATDLTIHNSTFDNGAGTAVNAISLNVTDMAELSINLDNLTLMGMTNVAIFAVDGGQIEGVIQGSDFLNQSFLNVISGSAVSSSSQITLLVTGNQFDNSNSTYDVGVDARIDATIVQNSFNNNSDLSLLGDSTADVFYQLGGDSTNFNDFNNSANSSIIFHTGTIANYNLNGFSGPFPDPADVVNDIVAQNANLAAAEVGWSFAMGSASFAGGTATLPTFPPMLLPLLATSAPTNNITQTNADDILAAAKTYYTNAGFTGLDSLTIEVRDYYVQKPGADFINGLTQLIGDTIIVYGPATGPGWFVDATPFEHSEFGTQLDAFTYTNLTEAVPGDMRDMQIDLLTAVLEQVGNYVGNDLLPSDTLNQGSRFLPMAMSATTVTDDSSTSGFPDINISMINPGEAYSIVYTATVNSSLVVDPGTTVLTNTVTATSDNASTVTDDVTITALLPFSVTKSSDVSSAQENDIITYTVTIANNTGQTVTGIQIMDTLDPNNALMFVDDSQLMTTYTLNGGETLDVTYTAQVIDPVLAFIESVSNTATVTTNELGTFDSNEVTVLIDADPTLTITKTPDLTSLDLNDTITYNIVVENTGNQEAVDIVLTDVLDPTVFVPNSLSTNIASLLPGASVNFMLMGTVLDFGLIDPSITQVNNVATATPGTMSNIVATDSNIVTTFINQVPGITLSKIVDTPFAEPGDTVEFTITINNNSNFIASNVDVNDFLGPFLINPSITLPNLATDIDIPAQDFVQFVFTADIDASIDPSLVPFVTNTVTISGDNVPTLSESVNVSLFDPDAVNFIKIVDQSSAEPGDEIRYVIVLENLTGLPLNNVVIEDLIDDNLIIDSINTFIVEVNDTYSTIGNTLLQVQNDPFADIPSVKVNGTLLDNDNAGFGSPVTLVSFDAVSTQGGEVNVNPDGSFTYTPAQSFNGLDSFTYTASNPLTGTPYTAVVSITVNNLVWYVDDSAAPGGDGRSTSPYQSLAPLSGLGGIDLPGSIIYLLDGTYSETFQLENGQTLRGEGLDLMVGGFNLNAGSVAQTPLITSTGTALTTGANNTLEGFNIGDTTTRGILANNGGTLTINDIAITGMGGLISANNTNLQATFTALESTASPVTAINLTNLTAGSSLVSPSTSITNPTGSSAGIIISNSIGTNLDFGDTTIVSNSATAPYVVDLINNFGSTFTFDNLNIASTNAASLRAANFGTISLNGPAVLSGAGSNSGLVLSNVTGVTNGGSGFIFESVSHSGGGNGIELINLSSPFTITGDGSTAGSGGTITGAVNGVTALSVGSVSLNYMNINNISDTGVVATNVNSLFVNNSVLSGMVNGIVGTNVSGQLQVNSTTINNASAVAVLALSSNNVTVNSSTITNTATGVLGISITNLTVASTSFTNAGTGVNVLNVNGMNVNSSSFIGGDNGVSVIGELVGNISVSNSIFNSVSSNGVTIIGSVVSTAPTIDINDNNFNNIGQTAITYGLLNSTFVPFTFLNINDNTINTANTGISISTQSFSSLSTFTFFDIGNNNISNINGDGIIIQGFNGNAGFNGTIHDNVITVNSGTTIQIGVDIGGFDPSPAPVYGIAIQDNQLTSNNGRTIEVLLDFAGSTNIRITQNNLDAAQEAIFVYEPGIPWDLFNGPARVHFIDVIDNNISTGATFGTLYCTKGVVLLVFPVSGITTHFSGNTGGISAAFGAAAGSFTPVALTPLYPAGFVYSPLTALNGENPNGTADSITQDDVDGLLDAAKSYWHNSYFSAEELSVLDSINIEVTDLDDGLLGSTEGSNIYIDHNAANYGWFVDTTPYDSVEFAQPMNGIDLLTVIIHEMGHVLGLNDIAYDPNNITIMSDRLGEGVRTLPLQINAPQPVAAQTAPQPEQVSYEISQAELDSITNAAIQRWVDAGISAEQADILNSATFEIGDLSLLRLAEVDGTHITVDADAGGDGWFVDQTPLDDAEYAYIDGEYHLTSSDVSQANGKYDLLTVVMHELGHLIGLQDVLNGSDVMNGVLNPGERFLPSMMNVADSGPYVDGFSTIQQQLFNAPVLGANGVFTIEIIGTLVDVVPAGFEVLTNQASFTTDEVVNPVLSNEVQTTIIASPELVLSKTDGGVAYIPGQTILYTINVNNVGNQQAVDVDLIDVGPNGLSYNTAASDPAWVNTTGNTFLINYADVNVGEPKSINIAFDIPIGFPIDVAGVSNSAFLVANQALNAEAPGINVSVVDTTRIVQGNAILHAREIDSYYDAGRYDPLPTITAHQHGRLVSLANHDVTVNLHGARSVGHYDPFLGVHDFVHEHLQTVQYATWPAIHKLLTSDIHHEFPGLTEYGSSVPEVQVLKNYGSPDPENASKILIREEIAKEKAQEEKDAEKAEELIEESNNMEFIEETQVYWQGSYRSFSEQLHDAGNNFEQRRAAFADAAAAMHRGQ